MMRRTVPSGEVMAEGESAARRRFRSKQERRQIAEESLQPGTSAAVVARRHGVNANQVFLWRKLYREGLLDVKPAPAQLMPVRIAEVIKDSIGEHGGARPYGGTISLEVGRVRIRVEGAADPESLHLILEHIGR
jgi:transposase